MLLKTLLAQTDLTAQSFSIDYPEPALVFDPFGDAPPPSGDTPPDGFKTGQGAYDGNSTEVLAPTVVQRVMAQGPEQMDFNSQIIWLKKSDRNPFANLVTLGRAPNNDVIMTHQAVSKVHITFSRIGDRWSLQDGNSKNGTYLNGERLAAGVKKELSDGDAVGLGGQLVARFMAADSLWTFLETLRGR